jgi:hypothetical protein
MNWLAGWVIKKILQTTSSVEWTKNLTCNSWWWCGKTPVHYNYQLAEVSDTQLVQANDIKVHWGSALYNHTVLRPRYRTVLSSADASWILYVSPAYPPVFPKALHPQRPYSETCRGCKSSGFRQKSRRVSQWESRISSTSQQSRDLFPPWNVSEYRLWLFPLLGAVMWLFNSYHSSLPCHGSQGGGGGGWDKPCGGGDSDLS